MSARDVVAEFADGSFRVMNAKWKTYAVDTRGRCECRAFARFGACRHSSAVAYVVAREMAS